jgi:hypothetical protein
MHKIFLEALQWRGPKLKAFELISKCDAAPAGPAKGAKGTRYEITCNYLF